MKYKDSANKKISPSQIHTYFCVLIHSTQHSQTELLKAVALIIAFLCLEVFIFFVSEYRSNYHLFLSSIKTLHIAFILIQRISSVSFFSPYIILNAVTAEPF